MQAFFELGMSYSELGFVYIMINNKPEALKHLKIALKHYSFLDHQSRILIIKSLINQIEKS